MSAKMPANTPSMTPGRGPSEAREIDLDSNRVGAEEHPARSVGNPPEDIDVNTMFECVCSNCGRVVPTIESIQCPP